jgi:hypothetical protein
MSDVDFADVTPHQRFERGWNRLQTIIEIIVALIVFAGLLGLFGDGPLSTARTRFKDQPITIDYDRMLRRTVQSEMTIALTRPIASPTLTIELPNSFLRGMDIVSTSPRSSAMRAETDGVSYVFDLGDAREGEIILSMKPRLFGPLRSTIKALGSDITLDQFVFP